MTSHRSARQPYVASLTGLRGIAALLVFLFHYAALHPGFRLDLAVPVIGGALQFPFGFGFAGVDVFFVLSGFLLALPFAQAGLGDAPRPSFGRYFKRRLLRVFPAYYAQLFIILAAGSWFLTWQPLSAGALGAHLLMFFNIGRDPVTPLAGVWWTLPVELGFYLLLPLLVPLLRPRRWVVALLAGALLSIAFRAWAAAEFGHLGEARVFLVASQLPGSLTEFLLGATAALLVQYRAWQRRPELPNGSLDAMFLLGCTLFVAWLSQVVLRFGEVYWLGHWSMIIAPLALGIPISLCVLSLHWGSRLGTLLCANRPVHFIGLISYSLYLWHFVVMQQVQVLIGDGYADLSHWLKFPLSVTAVVLIATISYFLVEKPLFELRSQRQAKKEPAL